MKLKSGIVASNSFTASDFPLLGSDIPKKRKVEISKDVDLFNGPKSQNIVKLTRI